MAESEIKDDQNSKENEIADEILKDHTFKHQSALKECGDNFPEAEKKECGKNSVEIEKKEDENNFTEPDKKQDLSGFVKLVRDLLEVSDKKIENKADIRCVKQIKRKRYSDQFKDPVFIEKDKYRKLKMYERFQRENKDLQSVTEKYRDCITMGIEVLKREQQISAKDIFMAFGLKEYGFRLEDFGSDED